jgi:hypothetical protein
VTTAKSLVNILYEVIVEVATLKNPAVAAATIAFVVALVPGVGASAALLTGIAAAVGVAATFVIKTFFATPPTGTPRA